MANCIDAAARYRAFADLQDPRAHISAADRALLREGAQQITDFAVAAETSPLVQLVHLEDEIKAHAAIMALLHNGRF